MREGPSLAYSRGGTRQHHGSEGDMRIHQRVSAMHLDHRFVVATIFFVLLVGGCESAPDAGEGSKGVGAPYGPPPAPGEAPGEGALAPPGSVDSAAASPPEPDPCLTAKCLWVSPDGLGSSCSSGAPC